MKIVFLDAGTVHYGDLDLSALTKLGRTRFFQNTYAKDTLKPVTPRGDCTGF